MNSASRAETDTDLEEAGWFSPAIRYAGMGELEVADPSGVLAGPVEFVSEDGEREAICMEVTSSRSEEVGAHYQALALVAGERSRGGSSTISLGIAGRPNTCVGLEVETDEGQLRIEDLAIGRRRFGSAGLRIDLSLRGSAVFEPRQSGNPRYLALPLVNFTGKLPIAYEALTGHPLRLLGERPPDTSRQTPLLEVEVNGCYSFIQPLPDKDARVERLKGRDASVLMTHLWVVELPDGWDDDPYEWFPLHLLDLLGLGSGTEVRVPWVEVRDECGGLCRRIHRRFASLHYRAGHVLIDRHPSGGWRELLQRAQSSDRWPEGELQVAATCLRRAASEGEYNLEDRWVSVCRALDALASHHGVESRDLFNALSDEQRAEMEAARSLAIERANELRSSATDQSERRALQQLKSKFGNVGQKRAGEFGYRTRTAATRAGFPDPDVVDRYLAGSNFMGATGWDDLLSRHRGEAAHGGYFDISGRRSKLRALFRVACHLTDLGLRMLLSALGYRGPVEELKVIGFAGDQVEFPVAPWSWTPPTYSCVEYYRTTSSAGKLTHREPRSINWVTPSTDPRELGYP